MIYVFIEDDKFINEKRYTFDLFFDILGIKYSRNVEKATKDDLLVIYAEKDIIPFDGNKLFIKASKILFNGDYLKKMPLITPYRYKLKKEINYFKDIIVLLNCENPEVIYKKNRIDCNIDIITNAFYMISRYEEYMYEERDVHKRFRYEASAICKANAVDRPIVNEYIEVFYSLLNELDNSIVKRSKWNSKDYVICISHDIDSIFKYRDKFFRSFIIKLIKEKRIKEASQKLINFIMSFSSYKKDPFWTFDYLMNLEEKYNYKASYYFMAGGESNKDNNYNINNYLLKEVFNRIHKNKSEIAIHGSYNSYNNYQLLNKEIKVLSKYSDILGIRQHYLRFDIEETWKNQIRNGIKYDTTLGFAEVSGFRAGICLPFQPYDLRSKSKLDIWEIPLIVMDGTLMEKEYMGLTCNEAISYVKMLMDRIRYFNGVFSILWHNSSFDNEGVWNGWSKVYEEILKYSIETNAVGESGCELMMKVNLTER